MSSAEPSLPEVAAVTNAPNAAVTESIADVLLDLGGISADRLLCSGGGRATIEDLALVHGRGKACELIDGLLVEKAMGFRESLLAVALIEILVAFVRAQNLGIVSGPDGFIKLFPALIRGPDIAFTSWSRLPGGKIPEDAYPAIVPDLVVEVISQGNTRAEMARKRREYFHAGVRLVWMVDPLQRSVAVFTAANTCTVAQEEHSLDGGDVLPGLTISLDKVFAVLDAAQPRKED